MKIWEILKVALSSLRANKLRSSLTILGIVIGIFSIISISTVIAMLQNSISEGLSQLGKNTFQIQKFRPSSRDVSAKKSATARTSPSKNTNG